MIAIVGDSCEQCVIVDRWATAIACSDNKCQNNVYAKGEWCGMMRVQSSQQRWNQSMEDAKGFRKRWSWGQLKIDRAMGITVFGNAQQNDLLKDRWTCRWSWRPWKKDRVMGIMVIGKTRYGGLLKQGWQWQPNNNTIAKSGETMMKQWITTWKGAKRWQRKHDNAMNAWREVDDVL